MSVPGVGRRLMSVVSTNPQRSGILPFMGARTVRQPDAMELLRALLKPENPEQRFDNLRKRGGECNGFPSRSCALVRHGAQ